MGGDFLPGRLDDRIRTRSDVRLHARQLRVEAMGWGAHWEVCK